MEPGNYTTNTILINSITSIPYTYLEPIPPTGPLASLRRIEASWRGKGALVVCDPSKFGLWIFGSGNEDNPYAKISSSCIIDKDGGIGTHGMKFNAEVRGTFETSALKSPDILQVQGPNKALSTMSPSSLDGVRNAQLMNARAAQVNSATSMKQGQLPSPVNAAGLNTEALDSTARILQLFISAVLGSASYLLCHDHGLIPMNARTLTSPSRRDMKDVVASMSYECPRLSVPMLTLDVALTPLGSLTLKASCQASSALSFVTISKGNEAAKASVVPGELVLLAPGAIMARYLGPCTEESVTNLAAFWGAGQNSSSQTGKWQQHCRTWLVDMGIDSSLLENCGWLMVQISSSIFANQINHKPRDNSYVGIEPLIFPWPVELCFVRHKVVYGCPEKIRTSMSFGNDTMDQDPLVFAEKWFSTKVERDSEISKRRQNRNAESVAKAQAEIQAKVVASSTYSPVAARRNSTVGVYPTPPDGVQVMPGATPNFDGTSTPGNVNQPTPMNVDPPIPAKDDTSNDIWSSANTQKDTQGSEFPTNDESDLFGEITNDLFGENDITDADFNFFDEPDKMLDVSMDAADNTSEVKQLPSMDQHQEMDIDAPVMVDVDEEIPTIKMIDVEQPMSSPLNKIQTISLSGDLQASDSREEDHSHGQMLAVDEKYDITATLSPELVFRKLFPDLSRGATKKSKENSSELSRHRRLSQFGTIEFDSAMSAVNDKYSSNGRFGYVEKSEPTLRRPSTAIPETEYLNIRHKRRKKAPMNILTSLSAPPMLKIETCSSLVASTDNNDDIDPNSGTGSDLSDPDDLSPVSEELPVSFVTGAKRKRDIHDDGDYEMTSSFRDLAVEHTTSVDAEKPMPTALDSDPVDWPLHDFLNLPQPPMNYVSKLPDNEYIAAAQILTDQVTSSTLPISSLIRDDASPLSADFLDEKTIVNKAQKDLATVARRCFQNVETCNLNKFLSIQGFPSINQIMRTPGRPQVRDGSVQLHNDNPFTLKTPYLEVRRSDSRLTVLPSAISFWEILGLGPCKGNKDIKTVCVFPDCEAMSDNAAIFLKRMRAAYETGKLGSHDKITSSELGLEQGLDDGLVSMSLPSLKKDQVLDQQTILSAIKTTCRRLGKALASISGEERNLVVYFIYPSDHEEILPLVCSGFYDLYKIYKSTLNDTRAEIRNELVLQLIPKQFVTSGTAIVVPSPVDYARLALEVYDRCADFQSPSCSPSILLEQPLPERVDFKLTANPSVSLLDENSCIHVAYAQSMDDRWISAAWTDNRGAEQMTASYCLGRKNRPMSRSFSEIANEIWETTLDIISHTAVNWRIMLAKSGVMDRSEIDIWAGLASAESSASVTLTLLSVKPRPSLQLLPPTVLLSPITLSTQSGMLTTPVSTPQALSIVSPDTTTTPARDVMANAPTPDSTPVEPPPPDATLIDITDQSWGSILSHRLNNSNSLLENNPALLSGYLIKRGGTRPEDTPILLEINIIGVSSEGHRNARAYEHLLKEIMGIYRGLGTLARVRGVVDPVKDVRPWHIAAVEKAVKVLYTLM